MSGSAPSPDVGRGSSSGSSRSRLGWWWLLVAVLAIAGGSVLVAQPWEPVETEPSATVTLTPSEPTAPTSAPSSPSPSVPPPGSDAVFDATTAAALFVTPADLVADVPAAETDVQPVITSGQLPWGLPAG